MDLVSLGLENNYLEVNDRVFRQKLGTNIETKFAPAYGNLFINRQEEKFIFLGEEAPGLDEIYR